MAWNCGGLYSYHREFFGQVAPVIHLHFGQLIHQIPPFYIPFLTIPAALYIYVSCTCDSLATLYS